MVISTAWRKASTSNAPFGPKNFIRLSEARLHAVSSRNMYSEQGLEALMRAIALQVCQRLTVESYCMPGSPQCQADSTVNRWRSEEHTSELQSRENLVCRLLLEKKKKKTINILQ